MLYRSYTFEVMNISGFGLLVSVVASLIVQFSDCSITQTVRFGFVYAC